MADYPVLTVLPVGMGSCNLIEVYEDVDHKILKYLAMVDCGSDGGGDKEKSLNYIWSKMKKRKQTDIDPYLDLYILTHQDKDHWSLIKKLIETNLKDIVIKNNITFGVDRNGIINSYKTEYKTKISEQGTFNYIHGVTRSSPTHNDFKTNHILKCTITNFKNKYDIEVIYSGTSPLNKTEPKKHKLESFKVVILNNLVKTYNFDSVEDFSNNCKVISDLKDAEECTEDISYENILNELSIDASISSIIETSLYGGEEYYNTSLRLRDEFLPSCSKTCMEISEDYTINLSDGNIMSCVCRLTPELYKVIVDQKIVGQPDLIKNASSAVTLWNFKDKGKYLLTGDCTVQSMRYLRYKLISGSILKKNAQECIMTSPHHGSSTTSYYNDNGKKNWSELDAFIEELKPKAMVISAQYLNKHGLPNEEFISSCMNHMDNVGDQNYYICYFMQSERNLSKTDKKNWKIWKPTIKLYSTFQAVPNDTKANPINYGLYNYKHEFNGMDYKFEQYNKVKITLNKEEKEVDLPNTSIVVPKNIIPPNNLKDFTNEEKKLFGKSSEDYQVKKRKTNPPSTFSLKRR